ncbi:MAG: apolipoprotein N-acyltransferase [Pseudomonadota bacterium]
MTAVAEWVVLSWGWRRALVALVAGALSALAFAPFQFPLILFVSFPLLVWLLDGSIDGSADRRRIQWLWPAFSVGWLFGFGYFLAGLYWIGLAFLVESDVFGWMLPVAVVALPAGLALFFGLGTALARLLWSDGPGRIFALAVGLGLAEWLRGHVLTGFPWNTIGYALTAHEWSMQSASIFGVYGLSVIAVLVFAAPALLGDGRRSLLPVVLAVATFAGLHAFGAWRLAHAGDVTASPAQPVVRLVQPNIAQREKWQPENRASIFRTYISLSDPAITPPDNENPPERPVSVVVWPESAPPFFLAREPGALAAISSLLPPGRLLVTGANRMREDDGGLATFRNGVLVLNDEAAILGGYDKVRLVPFGEMLPLARVLNALGVRRLVTLPGTFTAGRSDLPVDVGLLPPFRALICYEVIFSGSVIDPENRPTWIVNVTNDAWFGTSTGPFQHFHQTRVRAVEEGLPIVRAANTGISAVIDPYGRAPGALTLNTSGILDAVVPDALPQTFFARHGIAIFWGLIGFCVILALVLGRSGRKQVYG